MDRDYKKIKEISIVSHNTSGTQYDYDDLLRLSPHWFSYTRTRTNDGKETEHWSYKTHSDVLDRKFEDVCRAVYNELTNPHEAFDWKSNFKFNIRVTSVDGTYENLSKIGMFADNGMSETALAFLRAIPEFENYPEVISLFKSTYLTKKALSSIDIRNICAFMYAEGGAMGSPGCMDLITTDYHRYYTDGIYGRATDVSQFDVTDLFDGFHHVASYGRKSLEILKLNGDNWIYLNLGAGNHLLLRHDMYRRVGDMVLDTEHPRMNDNYLRTVAIPYKYGCGIANGDWDTVRSIFEEKLEGLTLVIYKLKAKNAEQRDGKKSRNEDPVRMIYEALSCLHKRGYEKLRIMSYYSPSGCYFRCVISSKDNFDKTGFVCMEDESYPIFRYSTGAGFNIFDKEESFENKTVEELADRLLEKYPGFSEFGRGKDSRYLSWYNKVLDSVKDGKYPYAFEDYGYDIYEAKQIQLTNGEWIEYAPPGSYKKA